MQRQINSVGFIVLLIIFNPIGVVVTRVAAATKEKSENREYGDKGKCDITDSIDEKAFRSDAESHTPSSAMRGSISVAASLFPKMCEEFQQRLDRI